MRGCSCNEGFRKGPVLFERFKVTVASPTPKTKNKQPTNNQKSSIEKISVIDSY
jgi:hypothetical protein